ncbi:hypothetical protein E1283_15195 [Streptomyces hainanensis]|uniref:Secreted protein n=2 Tax=Streptomyces hainanensis TaxID=402648 RepID=A0A4R4TKI6_9ACTN|nr:hypothetical protein E1283_15195 [Streptomyces hainanensis]
MSCTRANRRLRGLRRHRRLASLIATVAAVPLLTGMGHSTAQEAPQQRTGEVGTGDRTATVSITDVDPVLPTADGDVTISGTITNEGDSAIVDSSVAARQGVPLGNRSAVDDAMSRTGFDSAVDGLIVRDHGQDIGEIAPGMSSTFSLEVPVSELALGEDGVYQLGVTLIGQTETARWDDNLGIGRTLLSWQPDGQDGSAAQTGLTVMWPLISGTHLTAQTGSDAVQTPVFRDDTLLDEISPGGRLYEMVSLGADLPVTWVIDPDLLASVDAMLEQYQVPGDNGELVNGTGQDEARAFLSELQEAVTGDEVVALPFADPDLASLAHRGVDVQGALGQLRTATDTAAITIETVLNTEIRVNNRVAWPVNGAIDPDIVSVATSAGANQVIARSDSLRNGDSLPYTTTAARPIGGGTTAVVADARLSTLFEGDMSSTGRASLAGQALLAQTLAIHQQEPTLERSIVMAPQRMPTADQAEAMASALTTLRDEAGWVRFMDLSEAAAAEPDPAANQRVPSADAYPQELRDQELPTSAFQSMRETKRTLDDFTVILSEPDRVTVPFGNAIHREMSTSWRGTHQSAADFRSRVLGEITGLTEQVHLIPKADITLSGRSATIPVTVQNNLVQDVQGLELRLQSSRRLGLEISEAQAVLIGSGHSQSVKFSTTANANGPVSLTAQLYTADGQRYGEPMQFQVDVTSITPQVMMVIAGGLLLVVLAGIRMYTQRKRAAARQDDDGDGEDDGGAGQDGESTAERPDTTGSASPGETTADIGAGSSGGSAGSEKVDPGT